jgi:hypothetical protein
MYKPNQASRFDRYRELAALAGLTLGMVALPKAAAAHDTIPRAAAIEAAAERPDKARMPRDLVRLLHEASDRNPDMSLNKLAHLPYKEILDFSLGKNRVRVVQVGGELATGPLHKPQVSEMRQSFEMFNSFAHQGLAATMPVYEVDSTSRVVNKLDTHLSINPLPKDKVVFIVPARVDIGTDANGVPDVLTDVQGHSVVSFIRPDLPGAPEGSLTEVCQATVQAELNRGDFFGTSVTADKLNKIQLLGQENICNSLAKAIADRRAGLSFNDYLQKRSSVTTGWTNHPGIGDDAFIATMPHIADPQVYSMLNHTIPKKAAHSLEYPLPY